MTLKSGHAGYQHPKSRSRLTCRAVTLCVSIMVAAFSVSPVLADASLRLSWGDQEGIWSGLKLMNTGDRKVLVQDVEINAREECRSKPIAMPTPSEFQDASSLQSGLFALAALKPYTNGIFMPDAISVVPPEKRPTGIALEVGDWVPVVPNPCRSVVRVTAHTDVGSFDWTLDPPFELGM